MNVYLKAERDRLIEVYKKTPDTKIFNMFKNKYDLLLYCPGGYYINKDTSRPGSIARGSFFLRKNMNMKVRWITRLSWTG